MNQLNVGKVQPTAAGRVVTAAAVDTAAGVSATGEAAVTAARASKSSRVVTPAPTVTVRARVSTAMPPSRAPRAAPAAAALGAPTCSAHDDDIAPSLTTTREQSLTRLNLSHFVVRHYNPTHPLHYPTRSAYVEPKR